MAHRFLTAAEMDAEIPGSYEALPPQFRGRMPVEVMASAQNTEIIRKGFGFVQGFAEKLFERLKYQPGEAWPMWKLMVGFYFIEQELGAKTVRQVGAQIFSTMPWPAHVTSVVEAFRFMDQAYRASHGGAAPELIGGWPIEKEEPGRIVVINSTPYPFWLEDGTVTGVCRGFSRQLARCQLLGDHQSKRDGGLFSRYEITYQP